ncbi:calvin cycle protein CP12-2, chloroplastic-like [Rutidosis leptorrhynchoides]|uniref:calvin cycle protein CP12-2, chloroplastic-like n=1 Tax=Rutidosis leptorrhynchoides TaxID=125765 RepID=UPI003A990422
MATIVKINLTTPRAFAKATDSPKANPVGTTVFLSQPWRRNCSVELKVSFSRGSQVQPLRAAPDQIQDQVKESIDKAQETCGEDPESGECVAAWDEVEELSAAASHARDKKKAADSDPLETYCKDNPETDECRTYDS